MSQEKAQLIAPQGHFTVPGLNVAGVVTASSFSGNCTGTASSIAKGTNVVVGVMTASSFVGDVTGNVTGIGSNTDNLDVGIVTATSFAGNFTGIGSGLTGTPNVVAGVVTATKFIGNTPGNVSKLADGTNINVGVITATKFVGNTPGLAGGISAAQNINVGVLTATGGLYGDGSGLTGAGTTGFVKQNVTISGSNTTINLNNGNIIYLTHNASTTLAFSNVSTATDITIIRPVTSYSLSWPSGITWNTGASPTIITSLDFYNGTTQVFNLSTADGGTNWYGYEEVSLGDKTFGLFSWGYQQYSGQVGDNSRTNRSSPIQVPGDPSWVRIMHSQSSQKIATKSDGTIWTWGDDSYGKAGTNTTQTKSSPTQIGSGTDWSTAADAHAIGNHHALIVKTDGTLWGMGRNNNGQLGLGDRANGGNNSAYSSPTQIPGTTWSVASGSYNASLALRTDGTLWSWGSNSYGKLGLGESPGPSSFRSSPTQLPGTWTKISGSGNFMAINTSGSLYTWGFNREGQLGHNQQSSSGTFASKTSPTHLMNDVSDCSNGKEFAAAVKDDGTLWTWGHNSWGELGLNDKTFRSSPAQIPGTTWVQVSSGAYACYARKSDGTAWAWGRNGNGSLAQNNNIKYSSPVQIPGTDWLDLKAANYAAYGLKSS